MGAMVWSPLAMGMLTGRYRKGQQTESARTKFNPKYMSDEGKLDAVEQLIAVAISVRARWNNWTICSQVPWLFLATRFWTR